MAGVGAGTGALSSLLGKLTTLLSDEYTLLKGVRKDIAFLERELRRMQILVNILADMEKLDKLAKDWKGTMRDLSYDMEDCIDRFMVRLGKGDAKRGFMKRTVRRLNTIFARHGIGTQIKELKARVVEESERRQRLNLDNFVTSTPRTVEIDPRLAAFYEEAEGLVAMDVPMNKVMAWLMEDSLERKVVAIFGGGGLGKTTLAMELNRKIKGYFECRASVSVSRTLDLEKLLKDVLFQIDPDAFRECKKYAWDKEQLIPEIARILTRKRYFIIIDDVWKEEDWKIIKAAFPNNCNGSRIIATTRITNVARSCCSNSGDQLYQMPVLNDVDSRRLFLKRIFQHNNPCPPKLKTVSDKILKKCGGLPLAIITIASLLANKPHNADEWEKLEDSIGNGLSYENDGGGTGMNDILLLSYWDLPHHLKTCLLYLCIYPEDQRINCADLKWKWIAEGFIAAPWGNLCQEAENYFNELVNRNMIQPVDVGRDGLVHYCQVHDMVLDLIISLSEEENFATVLNRRVCNSLPSKIRRLSMQSTGKGNKGAIHAVTTSKLHVRSLNVFGETEPVPPLVDFHSLRVLDFDSCNWLEKEHIKNIGSCSQLRYLRISGTQITELPGEIGKLQFLETLDLQGCGDLITLPSTMVQLQKLARLLIHHHIWLPAGVIGSLHALEEISHIYRVDNPVKFAEELRHLTKLRKLSMNCYPDICSDYLERYLEVLQSSLSELCKFNLRYLHTSEEIGDYLPGG
ncbi:unnamed protein product [Triticum turgidum subsp. durum]|uniref:Uncharacterized protein n=1 Tax=Triticum turgidum subsp. durum TaxID=4567 RepID=A0A9R1Q605_TRITD|nr:unnamed protein product [Triticum turgidum subsp. durum]